MDCSKHCRYQIPYVETSAVTGHGFEAGINALLRLVMPSMQSQIQNGLRTKRFLKYNFTQNLKDIVTNKEINGQITNNTLL